MEWYYYIAWAAILAQLLTLFYAVRNYFYALSRYARRRRMVPEPSVAMIVPCKGLDTHFQTNIASFFKQDYGNYRLIFVVGDENDPAHAKLCEAREALSRESKATDVQILVAGPSTSCSQKTHNLLYGIGHAPGDTEVFAFADSDVCVHEDWLTRLVWPLRQAGRRVSTGYRWFVPTDSHPASLAMAAMNASVAQLLGNNWFNHAWGGSMAICADDFRRLRIAEVWRNTLSDDFSLSRAAKKAGLKVIFVPACIVPSFEAVTWPQLREFARRQFLITRVYVPGTWWAGFLLSLGSVAGFWGGIALAGYAAATHSGHTLLYAAVPTIFFAGQVVRAVLRQSMVMQLLSEYGQQLLRASVIDVLGCWLWSILLFIYILSSAFGRTIRWRGIRYRLDGPDQTRILDA